MENLYIIHVRLAREVEDVDEAVAAITDTLSVFHLMTDRDRLSRSTLALTVATGDLWQAILLTMNAITSAGLVPIALTAQPAEEYENTT